MINKIMDVLNAEIDKEQSGYLNGNCDIVGKEDAAEAIAQLILDLAVEIMRSENRRYSSFMLTNEQDDFLLDKGFTMQQIRISIDKLNK